MDKYFIISYAMQFSSFLIEKKKISEKINKIILFGSALSENFDEESDIDIFIDTDDSIKKEIENELYAFTKSKYTENWELKGLKNEISLKIGKLNEWKDLKREILSNSLILYGKYISKPEKLKPFAIIKIVTSNFSRKRQVSLWRKFYGYSQKVGKKVYTKKGLLSVANGKKLEKGIVIVPYENSDKIYKFLDSQKINYETYEIWSDVL